VNSNSKSEIRNPNGECDGIPISAPLRLLTKDELAAALRVSPRTVQEMVSGQEIPVVRIRGAVRFYLPDVVRSLTANAVTSKRGCAHRLAADSEVEVAT
jgi:excisionase family DNA binding protein